MMDEVEKGKERERRRRAQAAYHEAAMDSDAAHRAAEPAETPQPPAEAPAKEAAEEPDKQPPAAAEPAPKDVEQAAQKAAEYFEGWQRERADFANYRKRIEREQSQWTQTITANVIRKYLVILDDIDRAMKNVPPGSEAAGWLEGFELIYRKLQNILETEGIQRIDAVNTEFNPTIHEAISHEESADHQSGYIIDVVQQGYMLGDRLIRPALVRVAR